MDSQDTEVPNPRSYVQEWIRISIAAALCFICAGTVYVHLAKLTCLDTDTMR
jgi:hypothetical protein